MCVLESFFLKKYMYSAEQIHFMKLLVLQKNTWRSVDGTALTSWRSVNKNLTAAFIFYVGIRKSKGTTRFSLCSIWILFNADEASWTKFRIYKKQKYNNYKLHNWCKSWWQCGTQTILRSAAEIGVLVRKISGFGISFNRPLGKFVESCMLLHCCANFWLYTLIRLFISCGCKLCESIAATSMILLHV